jgi:hypothetical protein
VTGASSSPLSSPWTSRPLTAFARAGRSRGPLHRSEAIRTAIQETVDEVNSRLARVEQVKKFAILPREFSIDDGELTGTLKVRAQCRRRALHRRDRGHVLFGVAVALVGVGSFLAHGPRWAGAEWLHDVTIAWVLLLVLVEGMRPALAGAAIPGVGVLFLAVPMASEALLAVLAVGAIGREMLPARRTRASLLAVGVLGIGAIIGTLSRTGWPWCNPDSLLQGHALWHVMAAMALAVWGLGARPNERTDDLIAGEIAGTRR